MEITFAFAVAVAAILGVVALATWGASKLSEPTPIRRHYMRNSSEDVAALATWGACASKWSEPKPIRRHYRNSSEDQFRDAVALVGVAAVTAWGISKMLDSDSDSDSEPKLKRNEKVSSSSPSSTSTAVLRDIHWQPPLMIENNYDQLYEAKDTTNRNNNTNSTEAVVKWEKPKLSWYKLNTDGSVRGGKSGGGGLIRDDRGRWKMGFAKRLEDSDSALAELMALKEGLELAKILEYTLLEVEVDFKTALNLLGKSDSDLDRRRLGEIVKEIKELMESDDDWEVTINHVGRECNKCADALADLGRGLPKETQHTWVGDHDPPKQVFHRVLNEMMDD